MFAVAGDNRVGAQVDDMLVVMFQEVSCTDVERSGFSEVYYMSTLPVWLGECRGGIHWGWRVILFTRRGLLRVQMLISS